MRHFLNSALVFLFISSALLNGQTKVSINKKEFKKDNTGFDAAWQHILNGDTYFREGGTWYGNAYDEYVKATLYNSVNPELNYKTGISALFSDNKEKAADFFLKVLEEKPTITEDLLLFTGRALQYAGKYSQAAASFADYLKSEGKKDETALAAAKKYIDECKAALIITSDTIDVEIRGLDLGINTSSDEYSEVLSADRKTMYFASRRPLSNSDKLYEDSKYDENILYSKYTGTAWGLTKGTGKNLTTDKCETPLYLNQQDNLLYIYAGYENGGDIKVSEKKKDDWKLPENVPFKINTPGSETSMTFSPSGTEVWFVSDAGKDGLGGRDIYMIKKDGDKKWTKPVNAGRMINSPWDEESPMFSVTGDTLYFSSTGHSTIGGFDIFYCVRDKNGLWGEAVNAGYPLNTPWDEIFFIPPAISDHTFYFASNRPGTRGGLDIFSGKYISPEPVIIPMIPLVPARETVTRDTVVIRDTVVLVKEVVQAPPPPPPPPAPVAEAPAEVVIYLAGKVSDSESGSPVVAKIEIIDLKTDSIVSSTSSSAENGAYRVRVPGKKAYMADVRGTGYLSDMKRVDIPANFPEAAYILDFPLIKVKVGKKVVMNNILFETGKAVLVGSSFTELDRLYGILTDNPGMKIEISGHTDKTGSEPVNFKLSEARAKAVVDYLVKKGIAATRMEFRGFGSLQPVSDNVTAEGRAKNRRVEFKILEF
jgi:outer membrane protein OmpA-like peptidoglycan-associated protein